MGINWSKLTLKGGNIFHVVIISYEVKVNKEYILNLIRVLLTTNLFSNNMWSYFLQGVVLEKGGIIKIADWGPHPYVVIEYRGKFDPQLAQNGPHLNTKVSAKKRKVKLVKNLSSHSPDKTPVRYSSSSEYT